MRKRHFTAMLLAGVLALLIAVPVSAEDYSMLGKYTSHGYENTYFHYQVKLPSNYMLETRAVLSLNDVDPVSSSNSDETLSWLKSMVNLSAASVFTAQSDTDYISVTVQSPGFLNDTWADEKTIAENSFSTVIEDLDSINEEDAGITVSQISGQVDYLDKFIDGKHWCVIYDLLLNGEPYYGIQIYVRSSDGNYLSIIDIQSFYPENVEAIAGYFSKLN